MDTKRQRARPLSPDERRAAIITATRPLLLEHGRRTTTLFPALPGSDLTTALGG